jgi:hypothetical protein
VLWLDQLERYLAGLSRPTVVGLVNRPGTHVVILATMANVFFDVRAATPALASPGTAAEAVRAQTDVLELAEVVELARLWSDDEVERAEQYADDPRIAAALADVDRYGIAQHLAAGPILVQRWRSGRYPVRAGGHPLGVAIVDAAVDARRVGMHAPLPADLLRELCHPYLLRRAGAHAETESWEQALAWATELDERVAGRAMLVRQGDHGYVAFTYLVDADPEHGHRRMPEQVWQRLLAHGDGDDTATMGVTALDGGDVSHGVVAIQRAVELDAEGAAMLSAMLFGRGGDPAVLAELDEELADSERDHGPQDEETLGLRLLRAIYVGAGDPARGARELADLLERYGDRPGSQAWDAALLQAEAARARYTMEAGDPAAAAPMFGALVARLVDVDAPAAQRLSIQLPQIVCLVQSGHWPAAAALGLDVVTESTRLLGSEAPLTLLARTWHGHALLHAGDIVVAQGRLAATVAACQRVLGPRDRVTLQARWFHAEAVAETDPDRAARLTDALRADVVRFLGPDDPMAIEARGQQARQVAGTGDAAAARDLYRDLVDDITRTRGPVHPITLGLRAQLADQTGYAGDPATAAHLREELTADLVRLAGPTDTQTLNGRAWTGYWLGQAGRHTDAAGQYELLAAGRAERDGPTDPEALTARFMYAQQLGRAGETDRAGRLLIRLAREMAAAHGSGYRDLAVTCQEAAYWLERTDPEAAAEIELWYGGEAA